MHGREVVSLGLDGGAARHLHPCDGVRDGTEDIIILLLLHVGDQARHDVSGDAHNVDARGRC